MDRRQELRHVVGVDQPVRVALLADPEVVAVGQITDVSGNGMQLCLSDSFPAGSIVQVECPECVLRAAIIYSRPQGDPQGLNRYTLGIRIEHVSWELVEAISETRKLSARWHRSESLGEAEGLVFFLVTTFTAQS